MAVITSPTQGQVLTGVIDVVGTASHPDFLRYEVSFRYDPSPTETWFPLLQESTSLVESEKLVVWDTTSITDGVYMIRLRVFWGDGNNPLEFVTRGLVVSNTPATSTPTVTSTSPVLPTSNPLPINTQVYYESGSPEGDHNLLQADMLRNLSGGGYLASFCKGGLWSLASFLSFVIYVNLRKMLRPRVRRFLRRFISDLRRP